MARVKVSFCLTGDNLDFDILSKTLDIKPNRVRKKEDWPEVSIKTHLAEDEWILHTDYEESKSVSTQFEQIKKMLLPKADSIRDVIDTSTVTSTLVIAIEMGRNDAVEMVLSKENIEFAAQIKAEIGFDLYLD